MEFDLIGVVYYWRYSDEKKHAEKAKGNWNNAFHRLKVKELLAPYVQEPICNNDIYHRLLNTGSFRDRLGAGRCADKQFAMNFLKQQLDDFFNKVQLDIDYWL